MNKQRMIKLAGLLNESKKPLNEAKGGVIDQLYDVIDSDTTVEDKVEEQTKQYSQKIRKEYANKLNSTYRSKLESLVGKVITRKDVVDAGRVGLAVPFYTKETEGILDSPIKSASFDFSPTGVLSGNKYRLILILKFENGKEFSFM